MINNNKINTRRSLNLNCNNINSKLHSGDDANFVASLTAGLTRRLHGVVQRRVQLQAIKLMVPRRRPHDGLEDWHGATRNVHEHVDFGELLNELHDQHHPRVVDVTEPGKVQNQALERRVELLVELGQFLLELVHVLVDIVGILQ